MAKTLKEILKETPEVIIYAKNRVSSLEEAEELMDAVKDSNYEVLKATDSFYLVAMKVIIEIEKVKIHHTPKPILEKLLNLLEFGEVNEKEESFYGIKEELNGLVYQYRVRNKEEKANEEILFMFEKYLDSSNKKLLEEIKEEKNKKKFIEYEREDYEIKMSSLTQDEQIEWLEKILDSENEEHVLLKLVPYHVKLRAFIKGKGKYKEPIIKKLVEVERFFGISLSSEDKEENYLPYKSQNIEELSQEIKEDLKKWFDNEYKNLFLISVFENSSGMAPSREESIDISLNEEEREKLNTLFHNFFEPFWKVESLKKFDEAKFLKENKLYYAQLEEETGLETHEVFYMYERNQKGIAIDLEYFTKEEYPKEYSIQEIIIQYLKQKDTDFYDELLEKSQLDVLELLSSKPNAFMIKVAAEIFTKELESAKIPLELVEQLVMPEWNLNEVNEPWMTTLRLGKYEIKTKDMKSFLELIEALDGKYKNKLFIKTLMEINNFEKENITRQKAKLECGLLETKQKIQVLCEMYPKEMRNILALKGKEIKEKGDFSKYVLKSPKKEIKELLSNI